MNPVTSTQRAAMAETTAATFETPAILRRFATVEDRYRNETRGAAVDTPVEVTVWQVQAGEDERDRDQQSSGWLARFPLGTDVNGHDVLVLDEGTADETAFEIVGPPLDVRTHLRAELRLVEG